MTVNTTATQTFCGRCNHPMHWRVCGAGQNLTTGICTCRNDQAVYISEPAMTPTDPTRPLSAPHRRPRYAYEAVKRRFAAALSPAPTPVEPPVDDLGAAWAEAEAALPEGWYLTLGDWATEEGRTDLHRFEAFAQRYTASDGDDFAMTQAATPAAALRALAARLAATKAGSS